jgi:hypothetical protein
MDDNGVILHVSILSQAAQRLAPASSNSRI